MNYIPTTASETGSYLCTWDRQGPRMCPSGCCSCRQGKALCHRIPQSDNGRIRDCIHPPQYRTQSDDDCSG